MNEKQSDSDAFEQRTRELYEADVAGLDAATRSKLTQARQRALGELDRPVAWLPLSMPQTAMAGLVVAIAGGWLLLRPGGLPEDGLPNIVAADDIEILLAEEELEFLEEIEFYAWLEAQPEFEGLADTADGAG